ncbi:MAG: ribosome biogenesis GTPase Der [candidate division WOR-3 bacterium]|nr:ribosome biogenesis GTPase Der [candidate division WOR-3 bacterium]
MATVAIVGRKNVGKSSVFNRLVGRRLSIVHETPGVTRDRIYGEVIWQGRMFNLIDTGGFFPEEDNILAAKIMYQIELALKQADVIYFVVDGRTGPVPSEQEIADILRRLNKPVLLLVNKIDNKSLEPSINDFYRLGFDRIFPVSAEAGIGLGEVLDETIKLLPAIRIKKDTKMIKLAILGRPNAGKSTLLNAIIKEERAVVDEKPGTTRDLVNARFTFNNRKIELIDTYGLKKRSRIKEPIEFYSMMRVIHIIDEIDIGIVLFDATQGVVHEDCHIASLLLAKAKGIIIAPNKIDLLNKKIHKKIIESTIESFRFVDFAPVVLVSAKMNLGIEKLLQTVVDVYSELHKYADAGVLRELPSMLNPPSGGEIIKITQTGIKPPQFKVHATVNLKENYIQYLRNSFRNYFGFSGAPLLIKTEITKRGKR